MSERSYRKEIGDLWVEARSIPQPGDQAHLASLTVGFKGESERLRIEGDNARGEARDLLFALELVLAQSDANTF